MSHAEPSKVRRFPMKLSGLLRLGTFLFSLLVCLSVLSVGHVFILKFYLVHLGVTTSESLHNKATKENPRLGDFRRDWLRQRRARVDWKGMMESCKDDMAWRPVKWDKIHRSNTSTSEIVFWDIRPAGEFSKIFIQSKTSDNRTKLIGGDTWKVYVSGPSNVAATVFDHHNGTYEALFLLMEPGSYKLIIHLDYSLCDGFRDPPRDWFIKGNAQGKYQKDGILGTLDDYFHQPFKNGDPVIITVPEAQLNTSFLEILHKNLANSCTHTCNHLWDGFGRWTNNQWRPYLEEESNNLSSPLRYNQTGSLWIYGDSLAVRLAGSVRSRLLCTNLYKQCLHSYNWIYPVSSDKLGVRKDDDLDFRPEKVIETILSPLRTPQMQHKDSVLLLNLGIHFPFGVNFSTYQRLIGDVIHSLKETDVDSQGERVPKYSAKIIWKSSTFIHKEKAPVKNYNMTRWRFFTTQRVALFSTYAISAMCQAGFDVIDVYPMTESFPGGTIDIVHYKNHVFSPVEELLEQYKLHSHKKGSRNGKINGIKRCIG